MTMPIVSRTQFQTNTDTLYPDNTTGEISPADLRAQMDNIADSAVFRGIGFAAAPTANDDSSGNNGNGEFNIGDIWVDETNDNAYVCLDDTDLAAVWALIGGGLVITSQIGNATAGQLATWGSATEIRGDDELTWNGNTRLAIATDAPVFELRDNDAAADNQRWLTWVDSSNLKVQAFTDAGVGGDDYIQLTRTGNVVDSLDFLTGGSVGTSLSANGLDFTGAASTIQTTDAETLSFGTNGVDRLTFGANTYVSQFSGLAANLVGVQVGDSSLTTGNAELHLGVGRTGDGVSRIELVGDTTYSTYGLRLQRGPGENALSVLNHRGTGNLLLQTVDAGSLVLGTANTPAVTIDGASQGITVAGIATFNDDLTVSSATPLLTLADTDATGGAIATLSAGPAGELTFSADPADTDASTFITFFVDGTEMLRIDEAGNIDLSNNGFITSTTQVNSQTSASFTLGLSDSNGMVTMDNAGANTVTIDPVATTAYPLGYVVEVIQLGAGTTTIQAGAAVDLNGVTAGSGDLTAQYSVVKLRHVAADVWVVDGGIGAIS